MKKIKENTHINSKISQNVLKNMRINIVCQASRVVWIFATKVALVNPVSRGVNAMDGKNTALIPNDAYGPNPFSEGHSVVGRWIKYVD